MFNRTNSKIVSQSEITDINWNFTTDSVIWNLRIMWKFDHLKTQLGYDLFSTNTPYVEAQERKFFSWQYLHVFPHFWLLLRKPWRQRLSSCNLICVLTHHNFFEQKKSWKTWPSLQCLVSTRLAVESWRKKNFVWFFVNGEMCSLRDVALCIDF